MCAMTCRLHDVFVASRQVAAKRDERQVRAGGQGERVVRSFSIRVVSLDLC